MDQMFFKTQDPVSTSQPHEFGKKGALGTGNVAISQESWLICRGPGISVWDGMRPTWSCSARKQDVHMLHRCLIFVFLF